MFNPAKASSDIKKDYISYIETSFHFNNSQLQKALSYELGKTVSNGPFIEIKDAFKSGMSIVQLISDGVLSPLFTQIEKNKKESYKRRLPVERPLYVHQENAIRKIVNKQNVVVSTGTGSGKTFCFLIPVINELLREIESGTLDDGVRAMFIYPMNALANDQIKILRELLMAYPKITFGVYNGGTENNEAEAIKLYETMYENEKHPELRKRLPNETLSREQMKKHPPHILFTNYAMLEHMLFRPGDDGIFSNSNFKYVVLDEGHVYTGATGIETAYLISRLKARIAANPQFIITSATLGDGSETSNDKVITFAENITGCVFKSDAVIGAERLSYRNNSALVNYTGKFFEDVANSMANETDNVKDILTKYKIAFNDKEETSEILYDILYNSKQYAKIRSLENLLKIDEVATTLEFSNNEVVAFLHLCAKARKNGIILADIRYHYFLRALDGCYLALDEPESLTLMRKNKSDIGNKMFEVCVCNGCGELALIGESENGFLEQTAPFSDNVEYYQIKTKFTTLDEEDTDVKPEGKAKAKKIKLSGDYLLCKTCGAIVPVEEGHNKWCTCGKNNPITVIKLEKEKCSICKGDLRKFNLGFEAATGVIATSLYEQIPEYIYREEEDNQEDNDNPFLIDFKKQKRKEKTGSQFLVFSDSRQGAAKFACYLGDSYKEFLRRRGIWKIADEFENNNGNVITFSDFRKKLENYYSTLKLFRKDDHPNSPLSSVENARNAWIALLNELHNFSRRTSLVSLGKISFEYAGNSDLIVSNLEKVYKISKKDAKALLDYLVFEIISSGAILTDSPSDLNDEDRKYLYYSALQKVITKDKRDDIVNATPWMPTARILKDGTMTYYRNKKLAKVKKVLNLDDEKAIKFLDNYWKYLIDKNNENQLVTENGIGFAIRASSFNIKIGEKAEVYHCRKCGAITQFNIGNMCIQDSCDGVLERISLSENNESNHFINLYKSARISPLFIKEHTAQLDRKAALDYQQQFIRKEINALSCSTTFEMGVDVGDLETVFLRNIPPLPSNYAQRVGRAGRSIDAAAFALTYARLSSHDFTYFSSPRKMISGTIAPPQFKLFNEKIIRRHLYAVVLSFYLNRYPALYDGNRATKFINEKGYETFLQWLNTKPADLLIMLKQSFPNEGTQQLMGIDDYGWLDDFSGEKGIFINMVNEFEQNVKFLEDEYKKAMKNGNASLALTLQMNLKRYMSNDLIDMLVRHNILPKYGFPVDAVELAQNMSSSEYSALNLTRDLGVAISEYAPSAEVVADGKLYTSRYIKKPFVNRKQFEQFDIAYIAVCPDCQGVNYRTIPVGVDPVECQVCGRQLKHFELSIEPRAGFVAEDNVKPVPLSSQEKKYRSEAIYIGDKNAKKINSETYNFGNFDIKIESTSNDSLVMKSTMPFYVCHKCGYTVAGDENSKLEKYKDYFYGATKIKDTDTKHKGAFGKGECPSVQLNRYFLHHEFKTDVAKISFNTDTSNQNTMLSVMYALLNAFSTEFNIERRDVKACLTSKKISGVMTHQIIIYDSVPGGAGHAQRIVEEGIFKQIIEAAINLLETCNCDPSCYRCLRSYENQKIHDLLNRLDALVFLKTLIRE